MPGVGADTGARGPARDLHDLLPGAATSGAEELGGRSRGISSSALLLGVPTPHTAWEWLRAT